MCCWLDAHNITTYKSGSSAKADILGYISARSPIGITALDASAPVRKIVGQYASSGGLVFADSGAFRNFKARLKDSSIPLINFDTVFERYHDILDHCTNAQSLIVVAPDRVGEQEYSYQLLVEYLHEIKLISRRGAKIMVPMQKGALSMAQHYARCKALLNLNFIVGLPSNAEAVSRAEVFEFVQTVRPSEVHFLGSAENSLVHEAKHKSPTTEFSCDATLLRKHIGAGRLLTEMHQQIGSELVCYALQGRSYADYAENECFDESELDLFDLIQELSNGELQSLSELSGIDADELRSATDASDVDELVSQKGNYQGVGLFIANWVHSQVSPKVRTRVVSDLAQRNIV